MSEKHSFGKANKAMLVARKGLTVSRCHSDSSRVILTAAAASNAAAANSKNFLGVSHLKRNS